MRIAISAGHNVKAKGASYQGVFEYDLTVKWRSLIVAALGRHALIVPTGGLVDKVAFINSHNCDAAIEVHFNASPSGKGSGCETLYSPGSIKGIRLAMHIQGELAELCAPSRGVKEGWYQQDRPNYVDYPGDINGDERQLYFLRATNCPAVIVEPLFINELDRIADVQGDACKRIAQAVMAWGKENGRIDL
jgi:N-acetylmuramoyl-L-alanine amidase